MVLKALLRHFATSCMVRDASHTRFLTRSLSFRLFLSDSPPVALSPFSLSFSLSEFFSQSTQFLLPVLYINSHSLLHYHLSPTIPFLVSMSTWQTQLGEASRRVPVTGCLTSQRVVHSATCACTGAPTEKHHSMRVNHCSV